jgi:hypothetical protein
MSTVSFFLAGISAYRYLRNSRSEANLMVMKLALTAAMVLTPIQIMLGDLHGLNTLHHQPAKLAAMEGIWNGGTGFMLIKREVFEQLRDKVPSYINDTHDLGGNIGHERISEFFATSIEPIGERLLSEDYHFCKIWRELCGGSVWAAPWAQLSHIGTHMFNGILTEKPTHIEPKPQEV